MEAKDGGPAWPWVRVDIEGQQFFAPGMSLRDHFAAQAMIALHCSETRGGFWNEGSAAITAKNAYAVADAMLKARDGAEVPHGG